MSTPVNNDGTSPSKEQADESEKPDPERKTVELETRFREALASGKLTSDIITTDDQETVIRKSKSTNIFDL